GEIGGPHDAAGTYHFAADVNIAFGNAHGDVDGVVDFFRDVGFADTLAEFAGVGADGGDYANVGQADAALVVDLHGVDRWIGDALQRDGETISTAKLRSGVGGGNGGIYAGAGAVIRNAGRQQAQNQGG